MTLSTRLAECPPDEYDEDGERRTVCPLSVAATPALALASAIARTMEQAIPEAPK